MFSFLFAQIMEGYNSQNVAFKYSLDEDSDIFVFKIIIVVVMVMIARIATRQLLYLGLGRVLSKQGYASSKAEINRRKDTLAGATTSIATMLYALIAIAYTLHELGVKFSMLIPALGALGVVAGLVGQSVIKDFIKGLLIIFYDQLRVGDIVNVSGISGRVELVSLQLIKLRDLDGTLHAIPNGEAIVISNNSKTFSGINIDIAISHSNDIDKVEKVTNDVGVELTKDPEWGKKIIETIRFARVNGFRDNAIEIKILGKVLPGEQWGVAGEFRRRLKKAYDKNRIDMSIYKFIERSK